MSSWLKCLVLFHRFYCWWTQESGWGQRSWYLKHLECCTIILLLYVVLSFYVPALELNNYSTCDKHMPHLRLGTTWHTLSPNNHTYETSNSSTPLVYRLVPTIPSPSIGPRCIKQHHLPRTDHIISFRYQGGTRRRVEVQRLI